MSALADLDLWLFRAGNAAGAAPWLDAVFLWLTAPPHRMVWLLAVAGLIALLGGRRGCAVLPWIILAVGLSDLASSQLLKPTLDRLRPCFALSDTTLLLARQAHSGSFPSSHAANAFAAATVLFRVSRPMGWAGLVLAALIAYSRVYLGVHYPSDLAGGALVGTAISLGLYRLRPRIHAGIDALVRCRRSRDGALRPKT